MGGFRWLVMRKERCKKPCESSLSKGKGAPEEIRPPNEEEECLQPGSSPSEVKISRVPGRG